MQARRRTTRTDYRPAGRHRAQHSAWKGSQGFGTARAELKPARAAAWGWVGGWGRTPKTGGQEWYKTVARARGGLATIPGCATRGLQPGAESVHSLGPAGIWCRPPGFSVPPYGSHEPNGRQGGGCTYRRSPQRVPQAGPGGSSAPPARRAAPLERAPHAAGAFSSSSEKKLCGARAFFGAECRARAGRGPTSRKPRRAPLFRARARAACRPSGTKTPRVRSRCLSCGPCAWSWPPGSPARRGCGVTGASRAPSSARVGAVVRGVRAQAAARGRQRRRRAPLPAASLRRPRTPGYARRPGSGRGCGPSP
jgi:hypothetical protein